MASYMASSLKLVARGKGSSSTFDISSDATFGELLTLINEKLHLKLGDSFLESKIKVLIGFPPRVLLLETTQSIQNHISNQELLKVEVISEEVTTSNVIKANEKIDAQSSSSSSKRSAASSKKPAQPKKLKQSKPSPGIANIHGLSRSNASKQSSVLSKSSASSTTAPKRRKKMINIGGSESEVGANLVTAMSSSGGGNTNKFWRRTMSNAVNNQYEITKAVDRVTASRAGTFTIEDDPNGGFKADGTAAMFRVKFPKQSSRSKQGTRSGSGEHIDEGLGPLTLEETKGILIEVQESINDREMLKPENMSLCSVRTFWNIVKHSDGMDIKNGLQFLLPDIDWSFINVRHRELSEKAKANLAQQQKGYEEETDQVEETTTLQMNLEVQSGGKEEVQAAVSPLERRKLMAKAAEERFANNAKRENEVLSAVAVGEDLKRDGNETESVARMIEQVSSQDMEGKLAFENIIRNSDLEQFILKAAQHILHDVEEQEQWETPQRNEFLLVKIADMDVSKFKSVTAMSSLENTCNFSDDDILDMIDNVRSYQMDITMFKVIKSGFVTPSCSGDSGDCDSDLNEVNTNHILELLKLMNVETIRDLKLWTKHPAMFRNLLTKKIPLSSSSSSSSSTSSVISFADMSKEYKLQLVSRISDEVQSKWKVSSDQMSTNHPWLDDWITTVVE